MVILDEGRDAKASTILGDYAIIAVSVLAGCSEALVY
jgi:hypothetical protein